MLIFFQVCGTIDKNLNVFKSSIGLGRTNKQWNLQKGSLCFKVAYEEKCLKKRASEDHHKLSAKS